jgi:hypothetical protein
MDKRRCFGIGTVEIVGAILLIAVVVLAIFELIHICGAHNP